MSDLYNLFLKRRALTPAKINNLNRAYNERLQNIDELCDILKTVHDTYASIAIMPDFDCDGIMSSVVGFSAMKSLGFNVNLYEAQSKRGYGISIQDIDDLLAKYPQTQYIITCDVGITCYDAFEYAYSKSIKVLITDHHEEKANKPKPLYCEVIVNPTQLHETYTLDDICGAFVFYQTFMRYAKRFDTANLNNIKALAIFAGIGTVGDMMRIIHQNKVLLRKTVSLMRYLYTKEPKFKNATPAYQNAFFGLRELLLFLHNKGKLSSVNNIDEKFIGWTLVPLLNSLKRMQLSMSVIYQMFFSDDKAKRMQAIETLFNANEIRKKIINLNYNTILKQNNPYAPFIYLSDAPGGILGLLANKLMDRNHVPTFVINENTLSGSGRSVSSFPVIDNLNGTEFNANGHQLAFGIGFKDRAQVERFHKFLTANVDTNQSVANKITSDIVLSDRLENETDGVLNKDDLVNFYQAIQSLRPFGVGFTEPEISVKLHSPLFTILQNKHLKVTSHNVDLISWNSSKQLDSLKEDVVFTGNVSLNVFNGRTKVQLIGKFQ